MLLLGNQGDIYYIDSDNLTVLLNPSDIQNVLFSGIVLQEGFCFSSFFTMLHKYPIFGTFFEKVREYVEEYLALGKDVSVFVETGKMAVLTPFVSVLDEELSMGYKLEVFNKNDVDIYTDDELSNMKVKDYVHYDIGINTLGSIIKNNEEDELAIDIISLRYDPLKHLSLIQFVNLVMDAISVHGFPSERNEIINNLDQNEREEQEEIERQANHITAEIMKRISGDSQ